MRTFRGLFVGLLVALFMPAIASATPTASIELHADTIDYYSNRFILTADGHVRAQLSDGTVISGNTFSVDLKLNRYLIAGNVRVDGRTVHEKAAAVAAFPDLDRIYLLTLGPTPDRWTYFGQDYTDPHPGRQQPGDAFDFPNLEGQKPYIIAKSATIFLKNNVEFPAGSRIAILGAYTPTPGYVINYSSNPNFYQNAFSGAVFDIGIPFHGAADAISAAHIRYLQYNGLFLSFDQHFVHNQDYAVFSVNPLTQNQRQWNAILYKRLSPDVEARFFFQLSTLSQFLAQPISASSYANFTVNSKIGRYAVGLSTDQFNDGLVGNPPDDQHTADNLNPAGHPFDANLTVQSFEDEWRVFRYIGVPLKFQYRGGYGYYHDDLGVPTIEGPTYGGVLYPTIFHTYLGLTLYTAPVRLAKQVTISAKADKLEQWYSLPHHVVTTDVSATIARTPLSAKLPAFLLSYDVLNIGDYYGAAQLTAYPPYQPDTITNQYGTFSGLSAFDGFATSRTLSGSIVYTPTPYFAINLTMQYFNVTPKPVPGVGGQAPYQFNADVRFRVNPHILVDLSRSYYFNWASTTWSPQWVLQFSP
jgi:hypothetical protein